MAGHTKYAGGTDYARCAVCQRVVTHQPQVRIRFVGNGHTKTLLILCPAHYEPVHAAVKAAQAAILAPESLI